MTPTPAVSLGCPVVLPADQCTHPNCGLHGKSPCEGVDCAGRDEEDRAAYAAKPAATGADTPTVYELRLRGSGGDSLGLFATEADAMAGAHEKFTELEAFRGEPDTEELYDEIIWFIGSASLFGLPAPDRVRGQYSDHGGFIIEPREVRRVLAPAGTEGPSI